MEPYQDEPLLSVVGAVAEGVDWILESSESAGENEIEIVASTSTVLADNGERCPEDSGVVSSFRGSNGTVTTGAFPLFAFPGQRAVTISCRFQFCFTDSEQPSCDGYCGSNRHGGRRQRQRSVGTTVRLLPAPEPRSAPLRGQISNASHVTSTPVTCSLLVILLGTLNML